MLDFILGLYLAALAIRQLRLGNPAEAGALGVGSLLAVSFLCAIAFMAWAVARAGESETDVTARRAVHPDEPWRWRREWAEGAVESIPSRLSSALLWQSTSARG